MVLHVTAEIQYRAEADLGVGPLILMNNYVCGFLLLFVDLQAGT